MQLDFEKFPLNIYSSPAPQRLLESIKNDVPDPRIKLNIGQTIVSSLVKKVSGAGLLTLIDDVSIGNKSEKARNCLSDLIRTQTERVNHNPSALLEEAQLNLMASSCVTDYLSDLESGSWGHGIKNFGKITLSMLCLQNPLKVIAETVNEVIEKYNDICQVYHIAFLLNVFDSTAGTEEIIKSLIAESLSADSEGEASFSRKHRPILFAGFPHKSLRENVKDRMSFLTESAKRYKGLYDPFVQWRIKSLSEM